MSLDRYAVAGSLVLALTLASAPAIAQTLDDPSSSSSSGRSSSNTRSQTDQNQAADTPSASVGRLQAVQRYQPAEIVGERYREDSGRMAGERVVAAEGDRGTRVRVAVPGEFEVFVSDLTSKPVRRFGAELLVPESRDFVGPQTTAIPPDYRINPGDELDLGLSGSIQANSVRLVVNQDGRIFIPQVGPLRVAGVPYRDLQATISREVSRQFRNFTVSVTITKLHGITVFVTGFAATPGSYTVNSLSTVVNAVLAAGGPASGGSFRSIQVRRSGRLVSDFDLYDFLLRGDKTADIVLQSGDVIFIAPAGAQVAAIGSVNTEAIYEAKAGDTLNDILLYAGGANTVADIGRLHVLDPINGEGWQEISPQTALTMPARRGLVLRVLSGVGIAQPIQKLQSLVTVSGEVARPGRYFVKPGTSLAEVVALAGGLTRDAYPFGAVFVRDSLRKQQSINFNKAVDELQMTLTAQPLTLTAAEQTDFGSRNQAVQSLVEQLRNRRIDGRLVLQSTPDAHSVPSTFLVENNDMLYIPPQTLAIGVYGMVNSSADFRYLPGMRLRDYLSQAGGFNRLADKKHLFVVRANGTLVAGRKVLGSPALPGDLMFVPVDANRGAFWARLKDISSTLFSGLAAAASVKVLTN